MDNVFYTDNQYPFGGMFPINIPVAVKGAGRWLRSRMYRTVMPEGYSMEQVQNFIEGNSRNAYRGPNIEALFGKYTGQDSIIADDTQSPDYMPHKLGRRLTDKERKDLGVDNNSLRKYAVNDIILPSRSKEGAFEFAYPNRPGSVPHLPFNANKAPDESWPHSHELGTFHQKKDKDENGTYVIYEDTWDVNPFRGVSSSDDSTPVWQSAINAGKAIGLDKVGDMVPFGKPFEMHGRQYYNKEGYPKEKSEGGFLFQPKDAWDRLSMRAKSEMMKVAVRNGITDLKTIREKYNEFAMGGDKRGRMPAHPRNREKDPEAYDAAQQWRAERQQRRQQQEEQNRVYVEEKAERNAMAAEELNKHKDTVMSTLSDIAGSVPFTGSEVKEAAETQRQEKLDKWHDIQKGIDATMTAAELAAAGYGVVRGLTHFNRMLARQATQSTGQAVSREAMQNLLKWNNRVATIDKPQVLMNGIGGTADAYQWATANNSFDAWENGMETGANVAGVVGGMNWFRDLPILQRIGGNRIDAVLDGLGYGAAAWDVIKNLPPLSGTLEDIKQQSREQKAYGGSIHIKPENRGKFTALKERTGHSATWFKEHGTPAQKKMATFALNARHWKHGEGGNLFDGTSEDTQQMQN